MARKWGSPKQRAALAKMLRANKARRGGKVSRKRRTAAPKKRRTYKKKGKKMARRRRGKSGYSTPMEKAKIAGMGALLGYTEKHTDYWAKVPGLSSQGKGTKGYALVAVAAHFGARQLRSRWLDRLSIAAAVIGGHKLGEAKMQLQGEDSVGWHEAVGEEEISGVL
jgi:hypothetical protein